MSDWLRTLCSTLLLLAAAAQARELLVLTAPPVQAGKFATLAREAAPHGWRVRHLYADRLTGEEGPALLRGADLVLFDIPYEPVVEVVERKAGPALAQARLPWLKVTDRAHAAHGIDPAHARNLAAYYAHGGRRNFARFFQYLDAVFAGRGTEGIPPPILWPEQGVYHPDAPEIFPDAASYFAWKGRAPDDPRPVIAFALHRAYLAADLTAFIDHLIRTLEAKGAMPLAFYTPMAREDAFTRILAPQGSPLAEVIITSQIMLEPDKRRAEFARLNLPVIQAMPYRRGNVDEWRADKAGVHLMDVPFYLAQPEYAGVVDAMTAAAVERGSGQVVPIPEQVEAVVNKALALTALRRTPNAAKRLVVFIWNYPPGETNLGASYLNVPASLETLLRALAARGYDVKPMAAEALTPQLQRLLKPYYRTDARTRGGGGRQVHSFDALVREGLAERLPLADYKAWFATLPAATRARIVAHWGEPEASGWLQGKGDGAYFPIPRLMLGNMVILPQPPRGEPHEDRERALYHDTATPVNHHYLAVYLWARRQFGAHALIHFGTHGTQEWLPGKERAPWVEDDVLLPIADVPVLYPYIVDDVGEAVQAKRRGRALTVSHLTPPFAPSGLHNELKGLHDLVHQWESLTEGAVRNRTRAQILAAARRLGFDRELGLTAAAAEADFPAFLRRLHDGLHELALAHQPQGMHTLGVSPPTQERLTTVMQMLGREFVQLVDAQADETFATDYRALTTSAPYRFLERHVLHGQPLPPSAAPRLAELTAQARTWYAALDARGELDALLDALEGRHVPTSYGGDPIRNPDALPTGRNLYGFDPSRVPTRAAFEAGREALDKLIAAYRAKHGKAPDKLAFTLWSVETMRHFGVLEAQALYALGVRPQWDAGGRVTGVELIPRAELRRPRIDVVLSATGLYRDHFPHVMRHLAQAVLLAARAEEEDNRVRANTLALKARLEAQGLKAEQAESWAATRIFSNASGAYGAGIEEAVLASDTWRDEGKLARLYLARLQYAYGPDERSWGEKLPQLNLYAENLKGVQAAALARSSNLYGMLTTDDPFQYLGGIALAVRHLSGKSPELYIANLREAAHPRAETAAEFLARELRTRQFHPGWIEAMQREGYAGTTEMLDAINNFWGWQVTAPEVVRADQWQAFAEVYVRDKYGLGLKAYFERHNPAALAQMIERMLEAVRKGYWQADAALVRELAERYRDLAARRDVVSDNAAFLKFVARLAASGFGLSRSTPYPKAAPQPPAPALAAPQPASPASVRGLRLDRVVPPAPAAASAWLALVVLFASLGAGAWRQWRRL
ncbi:MAG: cobaltochelatase subunit CobN [Thiobacillaceae bacterium]|nr:cobaltochelatase subunit CobN [Thiobacillaceae bacterium]